MDNNAVFMDDLDKAYDIAKKALKKCYDKEGIVAGRTHFDYYWARDSFYASWGALELGDYDIVKKNLEIFLKNINDKGQVPIRIGASNIIQTLAFIGIKNKTKKPHYSQDKGFNPAIDPNLLLIITLDKYLEKTNDTAFAKKYLIKTILCLDWLEEYEKNGLIYAGEYATWQDMIKKKGYVLYTNVLYYQTLISISNIFKRLKIKKDYNKKAEELRKKINQEFWNPKKGYYNDFYNNKKICEVFSSDGNFFSIIFNIADRKKKESVIKNADKLGISSKVPSFTNIPKHNFREVYLPFHFIGMGDYNDYGVCWTWIGCLHSIALASANDKIQAQKILEKLSKNIIKDKDIYEVYEPNGKPLKRLFYSSEHPFTWTASLYVIAYNLLKNKETKN